VAEEHAVERHAQHTLAELADALDRGERGRPRGQVLGRRGGRAAGVANLALAVAANPSEGALCVRNLTLPVSSKAEATLRGHTGAWHDAARLCGRARCARCGDVSAACPRGGRVVHRLAAVDPRLRPLNAVLALVHPDGAWLHELADQGSDCTRSS
jgi:hypothetical protein